MRFSIEEQKLPISRKQAIEETQPSWKIGSIGVATTLLYLWLAVRGAGGWRAFFRQPARIVLAVASLVMAGTAFFSKVNLSSGEREDRSNRWIFAPLLALGLLSGYLPAYTERKGWLVLDGNAVRWLGVLFYVGGGALRIWPVFVLGRRFSGLVAIQPGHELVTDGVYRVIRHPSYLGMFTLMLGWALAFRSGVGVVLTVLTIPPILARIRSEEALLRSQFGEQYDAYRGRTARLIPGVY